MESSAPTLRYWDCQGRAQAIRDFLIDREVAFNDERVPGVADSSEWRQLKADPTVTGPFGALPVLEWDGLLLAETPVIVRFLEQRFDPERDLSGAADLQAAMATSAAAEVSGWPSGPIHADSADLLEVHLAWAVDKYRRLDAIVPREAPFFGGAGPSFADFYVLEAVEALTTVCGTAGRKFIDGLSSLSSLAGRVRIRPALRASWSDRPVRLTGRLDEGEFLKGVRTTHWSQFFGAG